MFRKTNADRICDLLAGRPDLDDDEISAWTGISPRQQVNQICRRLEGEGALLRSRGPSGKIVNRLARTPRPSVASSRPAEPTPRDGKSREHTDPAREEVRTAANPPFHENQPGADLIPRDLGTTLILIPCSGSKDRCPGRREEGGGILERLPPDLAAELSEARMAVRLRAQVDESTLVHAWKRYRGTLYQSVGASLKDAVAANRKILILSGGYGVVLATEPIGYYEAEFKQSWWPPGLLERVLRAYAISEGVTAVRAFASASTQYRRVVENTSWGPRVRDAILLMPASVGGGAMKKAPRAQGEALARLLSGTLTTEWTSTDGVSLDSKNLSSRESTNG
jgi:hypothetical protein